ncbi:hypothetical protein PR202_ga09690 [Eleusine coracana subsp. coracana]|uniref:Uncharacterized protein n=1 Tax=Eleusine coracana subsp. coracana TaxID=191504 RepID=A0AAV5C534_ELECO|nr:hypothetical protein PR202_ga09690 [Eleusine coracana subsp. coracana]
MQANWFSIKFKAEDGSSNTPANSTKTKSKSNVKSETLSKEKPSKKNLKKDQDSEGSSPVDPPIEEKLLVLPCGPSAVGIMSLILLCGFYVFHYVSAAAERYSAPSIVVTSRSHEGFYTFDDFREAYAWLRHNTEVDDKVFPCFWFVGYPIGDDINKFPWMVRIGGGVFPHIKEADYLRDGNYRVDAHGTPTMLNCLMYKLSYYRFVETDGKGFDRVRRYEIGKKHFKLTHFEEVE